jgi:ketosteroid isomerase-like protein
MSEEANGAVAHAFFAAVNAHDLEAAEQLFDPDSSSTFPEDHRSTVKAGEAGSPRSSALSPTSICRRRMSSPVVIK